MLKINFFHICENAIVEQGTKNMSIIGVFDNLNASSFPAKYPSISIVAGFESEYLTNQEVDVEFEFLDKTGEILKIPSKIKIGQNGKGNFIQKIVGYPIPREEKHEIKVNHSGQTIFVKSITINNKTE